MSVVGYRTPTDRRTALGVGATDSVMDDPTAPATLGLLARVCAADVRGDPATRVDDLAYDSRESPPDALFFCVPGARTDGHLHAPDAVAAGVAALVVERWLDLDAPQARVASVRAAMGPVSAQFFRHPSRALALVGVTGTNGKTTTTYLLERAFAAAGMKTGLVGTVEVRVAGDPLPVTRTTPEAPDLQRILAMMRAAGVGGAAMEVSSHGLALRRVDGTRFACGVFTNLTQDHLDFHETMEDYFAAKSRLFDDGLAERAAVNADDELGRALLARVRVPATSFGLGEDADVRASDVALGPAGAEFTVRADGRELRARLRLPGRFNVLNALAAIAAFRTLEFPLDAAIEGCAGLVGVPGRMERVEAGQDFTVIVDYAHTPDSLENVLRAARELVPPGARLVCVFGCGGDRDRGKRPRMGAAAAALADRAIVTSDNPRSEEPRAIIAEIEKGMTGRAYEVEADRRAAIRCAIEGAGSGDVVVIAGKGHETGQQLADHTIPFDDRVVARQILSEAGR